MKVLSTDSLPLFKELLVENGGFLFNDTACIALFYYSQLANKSLYNERTGLQLEDALSEERDYVQIMKTVAMLYGVDPNQMLNYWPQVDLQCKSLGLTLTPKEYKYRHVIG